MTYEEAICIVGDIPAWMLRDLTERSPSQSRTYKAARLLLKRKSVNNSDTDS